jgi:hypothetical protein
MIPYILAAVGGYLLGDSMKESQTFADGGGIDYLSEEEYELFNDSLKNYYTKYGEVQGIKDENDRGWVMFVDKQSGLSWEDARWGVYYGQISGLGDHYDANGNRTNNLINISELKDLGSFNEEEEALYKVYLETRIAK